MKTKLYLLSTFIFITCAVSAQWAEPVQNYQTLLMEDWKNNAWVNSSRSTNTYDANGHLIKTTMEEFTDGAWHEMAIMTNTLNDDGTVKETMTQSLENGSWQNVSKTIYTYNAAKLVLTASTQMNLGDSWMDFSKMTYTYNGQNQLTNQVTQILNMLTMQLVNSDQNIYSYNSDGTENQVISQSWNTSNEWENAKRYTNTYNNSKKITSDLNEKWVNNAWVNDSRTSYTLNTAGLVQESTNQEWVNNAWVDSFKDNYTYNGNNEMTQIVTQKWNTTLSQWENDSRLTYTYGGTGVEVIESSDQSLVVYPNPFTSQITIQSKLQGIYTIEVYNASGKLINSFKTSGNSFKLNMDGLDNGIYLIKTPQNNQSIKVLKTQ
ncbi:MAG: T9SS type A sorting domain-containing protein [Candidatus Saccharibacteria bacterium]